MKLRKRFNFFLDARDRQGVQDFIFLLEAILLAGGIGIFLGLVLKMIERGMMS